MIRKKTEAARKALYRIVESLQPITVRGAFYRAVPEVYPDTSIRYYRSCERQILQMRRQGILPFEWISDSTRRRLKTSSWSGLDDYAETVAHCYRRNFWARQPHYLEVFCEKDAMASVIEPATDQFDIHLNVIRGQVSETFVYLIAQQWREIQKPIYAYYLGDHDPAGLTIERTILHKLQKFSKKEFIWQRLAITFEDMIRLPGFPIKGNRDNRAWRTKHRDYLAKYGDKCVEVDAVSPDEIRDRVVQTIQSHVDQAEWARLQKIEAEERETVKMVLAQNLSAA